ncbi:hypothetical protein [Actinomadura sp. 3N508]|uniref:hypothetical protein n=1 Tax=Actinomadura sp. 3N508 TaxID=3375153 RepID=UPI00379695C2
MKVNVRGVGQGGDHTVEEGVPTRHPTGDRIVALAVVAVADHLNTQVDQVRGHRRSEAP